MERYKELQDDQIDFIKNQHVFFVGTAGAEGSVNVSPKGLNTFKVINHREIVWLNLTGSGNETSAHVQENGRMTVMFCSFEKDPLILRLYGKATVIHPGKPQWAEFMGLFDNFAGVRQFFKLKLDLVQTSCGYAVPFLDYKGERETLDHWSKKHGQEGIEDYWDQKNRVSLDGKVIPIMLKHFDFGLNNL